MSLSLRCFGVLALVLTVPVGCTNREQQAEIDQTRAEVIDIYEHLPVPPGFTQTEIDVRDPSLGQLTSQPGSVSTRWVMADDLGAPGDVLEVLNSHMTANGYEAARWGMLLECDQSGFQVSYVNDLVALHVDYDAGDSGISLRTDWSGGFIPNVGSSAFAVVDRLPDCS